MMTWTQTVVPIAAYKSMQQKTVYTQANIKNWYESLQKDKYNQKDRFRTRFICSTKKSTKPRLTPPTVPRSSAKTTSWCLWTMTIAVPRANTIEKNDIYLSLPCNITGAIKSQYRFDSVCNSEVRIERTLSMSEFSLRYSYLPPRMGKYQAKSIKSLQVCTNISAQIQPILQGTQRNNI